MLGELRAAEIGSAAFVRYGKAIAADANFASPDNGKAHASCPDDGPPSRAPWAPMQAIVASCA